jgi:hypothetical protein
MKQILIISALVITLSSCEETIKLDLDQTPPKVVIEGLITDQPGYQSIKITKSAPFYSSGKTPRVTTATVTVTDDVGSEFIFVHNPNNHPDSNGVYIPQVPFEGEAGRTYTLHATVEGTLYEASDKLTAVIPMDSLAYRMDEDEKDDPKTSGKFYEILMYAKEPQDQTNYYLFKFYRNDSLLYYNDTDIYYSDDKFLGESIDGVATPIFYAIQDTGRIEMYSISRAGYIFYDDLQGLLTNDGGGMFGSIPAGPRTNLTNGALGFFQVSSMNSAELILKE